jgi:hypothetical protein
MGTVNNAISSVVTGTEGARVPSEPVIDVPPIS